MSHNQYLFSHPCILKDCQLSPLTECQWRLPLIVTPKTHSHNLLTKTTSLTVRQFSTGPLLRSKCSSLHPSSHSLRHHCVRGFISSLKVFLPKSDISLTMNPLKIHPSSTIYPFTHEFTHPPSIHPFIHPYVHHS